MYVKDYLRRNHMLVPVAAGAMPEVAFDAGGRPRTPKPPSRVRVEFPETWLWSDSVTGYLLTACWRIAVWATVLTCAMISSCGLVQNVFALHSKWCMLLFDWSACFLSISVLTNLPALHARCVWKCCRGSRTHITTALFMQLIDRD